MSEPLDPERAAEGAISSVEFRVGPLTGEERAKIHGCVYGRALTDPYTPVPLARVTDIAEVLKALRAAPCRHCGRDIAGHALELTQYDLQVWCDSQATARPVREWLGSSEKPSTGKVVWSIVMWVGIPLVSLGFLAWLPATIATAVRRERIWTTAALVMGGALLVALVLAAQEEGTVPYRTGGLILLMTCLGGAVFGGLQVKRWLQT